MGIDKVGIDVEIAEVGINPYMYACLSHAHLYNYNL